MKLLVVKDDKISYSICIERKRIEEWKAFALSIFFLYDVLISSENSNMVVVNVYIGDS